MKMEKQKAIKYLLWGAVILLLGVFVFLKLDFQKTLDQSFQSSKIWVYIEVQIEQVRDTSDYYYYGQIDESIIKDIEMDKKTEGLFILSNIRYWNDDDLLEVLEDNERGGYKIFQIQNIQYIQSFKKDPIYIFDVDELHESARRIKGY